MRAKSAQFKCESILRLKSCLRGWRKSCRCRYFGYNLAQTKKHLRKTIVAKKNDELDPETMAVIEWCIEVEGYLVAGGATVAQAQEYIEDQIEFLTDQFYDQVSAEDAAKEALSWRSFGSRNRDTEMLESADVRHFRLNWQY